MHPIMHPRQKLRCIQENFKYTLYLAAHQCAVVERETFVAAEMQVRISSFEGRYVMIRAKVSERENLKWLEEYCNMPLRDVRTPSDSRKSVRQENRR